MEIILNLAWVACSLGLICFWIRTTDSNSAPRTTQMLALAMIVVLLLPVISLSDDLIAMQGPTETDSCLRRALHLGDGHPSVVPTSFALPEYIFASLPVGGYARLAVRIERVSPAPTILMRSLDRRPPPRV